MSLKCHTPCRILFEFREYLRALFEVQQQRAVCECGWALMSGLVHAAVNVWPCFGHVYEYTACVRDIKIGHVSVGVCACKQNQYAKHAKPALCVQSAPPNHYVSNDT